MVKTINREELVKLMSSGKKFRLVDVLARDHYEQEHIKGAISLPLDDIEREAERLLNKNDLIVVYCVSFECQASTNTAKKLKEMGFNKVLDYKGGLKDYKAANLELEGSLHESTSKVASSCSCC